MKTLLQLATIIMLGSILSLLSCGDDGPDLETSTDLLAGQTDDGKIWRIISIELDGLGTIDPFECLQDNNITYYPNGRYEVNEGTTKCNPNDPPGLQGSWSLDEANAELTVIIGDSSMMWEVEQLTENYHRLNGPFDGGNRTYVLENI